MPGYAPAITIRPDPAQIVKVANELRDIKNGVARAMAPAINKTLGKAQTTLITGLTDLLTAKRGNIVGKGATKRIRIIKATPDHLTGRIQILQRPIGLINFQVKDTRGKKRGFNKKGSGGGVIAQLRKDEPPIVLPNAFIAVGLSDNKHVFARFGVKRRQGKAHFAPNVGRLAQPIRSFKGLSLHEVWKDSPRLRGQVQGRIDSEFPKDVSSQVDRLLQRKKT